MTIPKYLSLATALASFALQAHAQTWTACNPLNVTDCPADPALGTNHSWDFALAQAGDAWNITAGTIDYDNTGASFSIKQKGDAPTIQSKFYIFFGRVEVWLKAAPGQGVVSSVVLESDDLDEIDLEVVGSNNTAVENNYYGKGNTTDSVGRARWVPMTNPSPQSDFHNYTTLWNKDKLEWYTDGNLVRTLAYADALGGENYPQTPMNIRIGIWAGGDPSNSEGTIQWAGGPIDYSKGPYTMTVRSVQATDFSSGKEYTYGDKSGSWQSIKTITGTSPLADALNSGATHNGTPTSVSSSNSTSSPSSSSSSSSPSIAQRWSGLSTPAKAGIAAGSVVGAALLGFMIAGICVRQRRHGREERAQEEQQLQQQRLYQQTQPGEWEKDTHELLQYRPAYGQKSGWERY